MKITINNLVIVLIYIFTIFVMMFDYGNKFSILFPNILLILLMFLTVHNFKHIYINKKKILLLLLLAITLFISILFNDGGFGSLELLLIIGLVLIQIDSIEVGDGFRNTIMVVSILLFEIFFIKKMGNINSNVACYRMFLLYILSFCLLDSTNIGKRKKISLEKWEAVLKKRRRNDKMMEM